MTTLTNHARKTAVLLLVLTTGAAACGKSDTVLKVSLQSTDTILGIVQFNVSVTVGAVTKALNVPDKRRDVGLMLPQTFTVEIPRDVTGATLVNVDAIDASMMVIARGQATLPGLTVGTTNNLTVTVVPVDGQNMMIPDGGATDALGMTGDAPRMDGGMGDAGKTDGPRVDAGAPDVATPEPDAPVVEPDAAPPEPDVAPPEPDADMTPDAPEDM